MIKIRTEYYQPKFKTLLMTSYFPSHPPLQNKHYIKTIYYIAFQKYITCQAKLIFFVYHQKYARLLFFGFRQAFQIIKTIFTISYHLDILCDFSFQRCIKVLDFLQLNQKEYMQRESFRDKNLFTDEALESCGFEIASKRTLTKSLYRVIPNGQGSALYDAIVQSLQNLRNLYLMIEESGTAEEWRFAIIIVLSGPDTCSKATWQQVKYTYEQTKMRLKVHKLELIFIAFNVEKSIYSNMFFLQSLDIDVALHFASDRKESDLDENIGRLMQRIRQSVGLNDKKQKEYSREDKSNEEKVESLDSAKLTSPYDRVKKVYNYGVLFTLSADNHYGGQAWIGLCHGIQTFSRFLGSQDLIGVMVYTEQTRFFQEGQLISRSQAIMVPAQEQIPPPEQQHYPEQQQQPQYAPLPPHMPYNYNNDYLRDPLLEPGSQARYEPDPPRLSLVRRVARNVRVRRCLIFSVSFLVIIGVFLFVSTQV